MLSSSQSPSALAAASTSTRALPFASSKWKAAIPPGPGPTLNRIREATPTNRIAFALLVLLSSSSALATQVWIRGDDSPGTCLGPELDGDFCAVSHDTGGTTANPGDDELWVTNRPRDVGASVDAPVEYRASIGLDGGLLVLEHPVNRLVNDTWDGLNASRPHDAQGVIWFTERPRNGENPKWGYWIDMRQPEKRSVVGWCPDICYLDTETWWKGNDTHMALVPEGVIIAPFFEKGTDAWIMGQARGENVVCLASVIPDSRACEVAVLADPLLLQGAENTTRLAPTIHFTVAIRNVTLETGPPSNLSLPPTSRPPEPLESAEPTDTHQLGDVQPARQAPAPAVPSTVDLSSSSSEPDFPSDEVVRAEVRVIPNQRVYAALPIVIAAAAVLLLALLAALFTRLKRDRVLANVTRSAIYATISNSGGRTIEQLAEATGLHRNTIRYHLGILDELGLVRATTSRPRVIKPAGLAVEPAVPTHPGAQRVYTHLSQAGPSSPGSIAKALALPAYSVSRYIRRLADAGLVELQGQKRTRLVKAVPTALIAHPASRDTLT